MWTMICENMEWVLVHPLMNMYRNTIGCFNLVWRIDSDHLKMAHREYKKKKKKKEEKTNK